MSQEALFHERIEEALDEVIKACGGRKRFAAEMWPDKPARDAHNLLDACLNPERRERLSPAQVIYVMQRGRAKGCHAVMRYVARECGYEEPKAIEPEDQRAKLQREFIEAQRRMEVMLADMKTLPGATPVHLAARRD